MKKLKELFEKYRDLISYLFFGGLTTAVHYAVYIPCDTLLGWDAWVCTAIAWSAAVIFAYLTNKPFVYQSHDWSAKVLFPEFGKFTVSRLGSGLLNVLLMWLTVDILQWNSLLMMVIVSVLVVIINYVTGKLMVFTKKK